MNNGNEFDIKYLTSDAFIKSAIVLVIMFILLYIIKQYLIKRVAYTNKDEQHKNTFKGIIFSVMQYLVVILAIVTVMKINGINIAGILTGLGIFATIVGLALQDTLKDIISGINIYNNNFYKVGDMVRWNGEECDVKYFSARVTKFQSVYTNSTYTVCNSQINAIEKIKDVRFKTFRFRFDDDKKKIDKAFKKVAERMKDECKYVKDAIYLGPIDITYEGVEFGLLYKCPAHKNLEISMKMIEFAFDEFKKAGVMPDQNSFSIDTTRMN